MPSLHELEVFDNSEEGHPEEGVIPNPKLLLRWRDGAVLAPGIDLLVTTPEWAKPIAAAAMKLQRSSF